MDVVLIPQPDIPGIWFQRSDSPSARPILASTRNVTDTTLATSIGQGPERISTLEHLLAAAGGLGISNLKIEVNGPEIPILDGSAAPWVMMFNKAGITTLNVPQAYYRIKRPFRLVEEDKFLAAEPSPIFSLDCSIEFPGYLKAQSRHFSFSKSAFVRDISPARTFCLEKDVRTMRSNNLALGGGLDNAVVVSDNGTIINPEGLRFPDECVRHKILDFIGDLTLAGLPVIGRFTAHKTGHTLNQRFLKTILQTPGIVEKVLPESEVKDFELPIPGVAPAA
jgi:UDP-3-O-[3-hydroxymyristoyl] N-acetylglucosamine deacetylase